MADFKTNHGDVNSGVATEREPKQGDNAQSCCTDNAPKGGRIIGGPGPSIGANTRRIS